jgi:predicted dinucleotide-binding enzyme
VLIATAASPSIAELLQETANGLRSALGDPGLAVGAALVILVGNPLSGLSSAPELLPSGWGALGQLLPPGAGGTLLRAAAYFDGHGSGGALLVLAAWLLIGIALVVLGRRRTAVPGTPPPSQPKEHTMRIGLLGTGRAATAAGTGFAAAGHDVVLGSRTPRAKQDRDLPVVGLREAATHADAVVNATLGSAPLDVLSHVGAEPLAGKPLIDLALAVTPEMELAYPNSSLAEKIQAAFPQAKVVKTLSTIPAAMMSNPGALGGPSTVFLSGDDPGAKRTVGALLSDLGWPEEQQLDLGGITTARGPEHLVPLLLAVFGALGTTAATVAVVR